MLPNKPCAAKSARHAATENLATERVPSDKDHSRALVVSQRHVKEGKVRRLSNVPQPKQRPAREA